MKKEFFLIIITLMLLCVGLCGCTENFSVEENKFKMTVINTFDEKMLVELYIFKNANHEDMDVQYCTLEQNQGYAFNFECDDEDGIYGIDVTATNYTYYYDTDSHPKGTLPDGSEYTIKVSNMNKTYVFPDGKIQNLFVAITPPLIQNYSTNTSGNLTYYVESQYHLNLSKINIVIIPMPESDYITKIEF